jgi:hypothetical protein
MAIHGGIQDRESGLERSPELHQAPRFLPLFHRREERVGERRSVFVVPLSSVLFPLVPHGARMESLMQP